MNSSHENHEQLSLFVEDQPQPIAAEFETRLPAENPNPYVTQEERERRRIERETATSFDVPPHLREAMELAEARFAASMPRMVGSTATRGAEANTQPLTSAQQNRNARETESRHRTIKRESKKFALQLSRIEPKGDR